MKENRSYEKAKKKVEKLKSFYTHLFIYIAVNIGLFLIDIISSPGALWFYWPLIGWGIGVAIHGLNVLGIEKLLGKNWEEKKIKELMGKEKIKKKK